MPSPLAVVSYEEAGDANNNTGKGADEHKRASQVRHCHVRIRGTLSQHKTDNTKTYTDSN